jgi:ATP-dependent DNA ligase
LEGLVIKDALSRYEPGRRKWLKIKRDYLGDGAMADSADLVVLGGYFGTGSKGGKVSVFLCGVYDKTSRQWKTVCAGHALSMVLAALSYVDARTRNCAQVAKVGNGHDDDAIDRLNAALKVGTRI